MQMTFYSVRPANKLNLTLQIFILYDTFKITTQITLTDNNVRFNKLGQLVNC